MLFEVNRRSDDLLELHSGMHVAWIFGPIAIVAGIVTTLWLVEVSTFECVRGPDEPACVLSRSRSLWTNRDVFPLASMRGARVDERRHHQHTGDTWTPVYRAEAMTSGGAIPLLRTHTASKASAREIVRRIEEFLARPDQERLRIDDSNRTFAYGLGALIAGIGLLVLPLGHVRRVRLFRTGNAMTIVDVRLFGRRERARAPLDRIAGVRLESALMDDDKGVGFRLAFVMQDGSITPLSQDFSTPREHLERSATAANEFLAAAAPRHGA
jgi:hypothetical protein